MRKCNQKFLSGNSIPSSSFSSTNSIFFSHDLSTQDTYTFHELIIVTVESWLSTEFGITWEPGFWTYLWGIT